MEKELIVWYLERLQTDLSFAVFCKERSGRWQTVLCLFESREGVVTEAVTRLRWVFGAGAPLVSHPADLLSAVLLSELHSWCEWHPQLSGIFSCRIVSWFACSHYFKICYLSTLGFYWYYSFNSNIGYSRHCLKAYFFVFLKGRFGLEQNQ